MDAGNLNRLMKLTELPDFIIKAFKSPLELKVHYAPVLLKLLSDKVVKEKLYKKAWELKEKVDMDGQKIYKCLIAAAKTTIAKSTDSLVSFHSKQGEKLFSYKTRGQDILEFSINKRVTQSHIATIKAEVLALIDAHFNPLA
jgi:hypothetical protein